MFGIFSDEGLLEGDFATAADAHEVAISGYSEDATHVAECCPDHPEHERETCEPCESEGDEGEGDEGEEA